MYGNYKQFTILDRSQNSNSSKYNSALDIMHKLQYYMCDGIKGNRIDSVVFCLNLYVFLFLFQHNNTLKRTRGVAVVNYHNITMKS